MPTVSIVTPVYNAVGTLPKTANTVLAQTCADWEWILVDDGSTDDTYALCCALADRDSRITALKIPPEGVSAARNAGLDAAKGQYIMFLDADDLLAPEAVEQALAAQKKYPDCWILWRYDVSVNNEAFWGGELSSSGETLYTAADLGDLYGKCFIAMPWNKLYRADVAKSIRFDRNYSLGEDLLFCLDYLKAVTAQGRNGICVVHQSLIEYVIGGTNTLSTKYLPQYLPLWEHHFKRLNAECAAYGAPAKDVESLHRQELAVMSRGIADILHRDPAPEKERRAKAKAALANPWLKELCRALKAENAYSAFYLPVLWKNLWLLEKMVTWQAEGNPLFGKLDWAGYYLLGGRRSRE